MSATFVATRKSYGAFELKEYISKSTWRAYVVTMLLILFLLLLNFALDIFTTHTVLEAPLRMDRKDIAVDLAPPPTENIEQPPPPPPDVVYSGPAARAGVPVPVPDADIAPDVKDFANTDEISRASSEGGSGEDFGGFAANIKTDDNLNVKKEEPEPDPDDFVSVEEEPYVDLAALQRKVVYPEMAKRAGIEGRVTIRVLVGKDGKPKKYRIDDSDNDILNKAAADAVMSSTFPPARQNKMPVECWVSIPITFKLK